MAGRLQAPVCVDFVIGLVAQPVGCPLMVVRAPSDRRECRSQISHIITSQHPAFVSKTGNCQSR